MIPFSLLFLFNGFSFCINHSNSIIERELHTTIKINNMNLSDLENTKINIQQSSLNHLNQNQLTHTLIKENNNNNQYDNSDDNDVPPVLPTRTTEEIIHRDSSDSVRFKVVTYVGLSMIVIILCLFIFWKFCPRACFCGSSQDEDINGEIGIESGIGEINGQLQIDTIDQNDNEPNLDVNNMTDTEGAVYNNEDQKDKYESKNSV